MSDLAPEDPALRGRGWLPRSWQSRVEPVVFAGLIVLELVLLWGFRYFPSQDGPAHLNNAAILLNYHRPELSLLQQYYVIRLAPMPNWLDHGLLVLLMTLFPPLIAERLVLTGYVIAFPLCVRYALRQIRPDAGWLALLAIPLVPNLFHHMGFQSFCYGMAIQFAVVGAWFRHRQRWTRWALVKFCGWTTLLYFAHLLSLFMGLATIGILALWLALLDFLRPASLGSRGANGWHNFRSNAVLPAIAATPSLALVAWYVHRFPASNSHHLPIEERWLLWDQFSALISFDAGEVPVAKAVQMLFVGLFAGLLVWKLIRARWERLDGLLWVVIAGVALFWAAPDQASGGSMITFRLLLFPYLTALLWFGVQSYGRWTRGVIQLVVVALTLWQASVLWRSYTTVNAYLTAYMWGQEQIEPNSTLLGLCYSSHGTRPDGTVVSVRVEPFRHAAGILAAERGLVDLTNYEAVSGVFPVAYRAELNPYKYVSPSNELVSVPPVVDLLAYSQKTGGRIDYVLLWNLTDANRKDQRVQGVFWQLRQAYDEISASPDGRMFLYRRRGE